MTCTTSHSPPLAECTVDSTNQSSSSAGGPARSPGRHGRVEGQPGDEPLPARRPGGLLGQTLEVGATGRGRVVPAGITGSSQPRSRSIWTPTGGVAAGPAGAGAVGQGGPQPGELGGRRRPGPMGARPGSGPEASGAPGSSRRRGRRGRRRRPRRTPRLVHDPAGRRRADPVEQLQDAEPGQLVPRVVQQPQQRHQILHVGGLQEAQAPVLHVGDAAAGRAPARARRRGGWPGTARPGIRRATPASRWPSTESQTASAWAASS